MSDARRSREAHEWTYDVGGGPFTLFLGDVAGPGEEPCPLIETSLPQEIHDLYTEEGILLDACAEEILRLTGVIAALEAEIERLKAEKREEFAVLEGAIDELTNCHARTEALSDRGLRPDGSER